jgi:hypothetical protein
MRILASIPIRSFPMRSRHFDLQIFLEVGHVLSNVHELRLTNDTSSPGTAIDRPENDIVMRRA